MSQPAGGTGFAPLATPHRGRPSVARSVTEGARMVGFILLAIAILAMVLMMIVASRKPNPDQEGPGGHAGTW